MDVAKVDIGECLGHASHMRSSVHIVDWQARLRLHPDVAVPLYHQLRERLRAAARECEPDTLIPSEKEIMTYAGVSRATARRAIADLVQDGVLLARQGRGTFTAPRRVQAALGQQPAGFTETMRRLGRNPRTEVLSADVVEAPAELAARLELPPAARVFVLERLRLLDEEPCMVEKAHLSADLFPDLLDQDLTGSLYDVLRLRYGLGPAQGVETIIAVNADRRMANLLRVPVAAALIATARTTSTESGRPIEYTLRHARGDLCSFGVELRGTSSALGDQSLLDPLLAGRSA
jgi:GntR family transcriptional regulator